MKLISYLILSSLFLFWEQTEGQVINTISSDKTNMYVHAMDTVAKIVLKETKYQKIEVVADRSITSNLPKTLANIELTIITHEDAAKAKIKKDAARFVVGTVQIIRDQFKIRILTWGHDGRLGDGAYFLRYKYGPDTMTYELKAIEKGMTL